VGGKEKPGHEANFFLKKRPFARFFSKKTAFFAVFLRKKAVFDGQSAAKNPEECIECLLEISVPLFYFTAVYPKRISSNCFIVPLSIYHMHLFVGTPLQRHEAMPRCTIISR